MVQIETNEDSSSLSHSQMEPGNNNTKKRRRVCKSVHFWAGWCVRSYEFVHISTCVLRAQRPDSVISVQLSWKVHICCCDAWVSEAALGMWRNVYACFVHLCKCERLCVF